MQPREAVTLIVTQGRAKPAWCIHSGKATELPRTSIRAIRSIGKLTDGLPPFAGLRRNDAEVGELSPQVNVVSIDANPLVERRRSGVHKSPRLIEYGSEPVELGSKQGEVRATRQDKRGISKAQRGEEFGELHLLTFDLHRHVQVEPVPCLHRPHLNRGIERGAILTRITRMLDLEPIDAVQLWQYFGDEHRSVSLSQYLVARQVAVRSLCGPFSSVGGCARQRSRSGNEFRPDKVREVARCILNIGEDTLLFFLILRKTDGALPVPLDVDLVIVMFNKQFQGRARWFGERIAAVRRLYRKLLQEPGQKVLFKGLQILLRHRKRLAVQELLRDCCEGSIERNQGELFILLAGVDDADQPGGRLT